MLSLVGAAPHGLWVVSFSRPVRGSCLAYNACQTKIKKVAFKVGGTIYGGGYATISFKNRKIHGTIS